MADTVVAVDKPRRDELWQFRAGHPTAIGSLGTSHKLDLQLPMPHLAEFLHRVPQAVAALAPAASAWLFGHAADGGVHVNVSGVGPDDHLVTSSSSQPTGRSVFRALLAPTDDASGERSPRS